MIGRITLLLFLLTSCYVSEELPEDQTFWTYSQPEALGFGRENLFFQDAEIKKQTYGDINSLMIIKENQILYENYYDGSFRNRQRPLDIATFGYTIAFLDLFIEEGLIESLDDPIMNYLPEYQAQFDETPIKKQITFRHLILQLSGLSWNQSFYPIFDSRSDFVEMKKASDWAEYLISKPQSPIPGQQFALNSGSGILLCKIYQNVLGNRPLLDFLDEHYFSVLDIKEYSWNADPSGTLDGATGLSLTSFDHAKLGSVLVNGGRTPEKKRVFTESWVAEMTTFQVAFNNQFDYGYGWRILKPESDPNINLDNFICLSGFIGQHLYINTEESLVVAIGAENYFQLDFYNSSLILLMSVIGAQEAIQ